MFRLPLLLHQNLKGNLPRYLKSKLPHNLKGNLPNNLRNRLPNNLKSNLPQNQLSMHHLSLKVSITSSFFVHFQYYHLRVRHNLISNAALIILTDLLNLKCSQCFLIFSTVALFRKHKKTVCTDGKGLALAGSSALKVKYI